MKRRRWRILYKPYSWKQENEQFELVESQTIEGALKRAHVVMRKRGHPNGVITAIERGEEIYV